MELQKSNREQLRKSNMLKMLNRDGMRGFTEDPEYAKIRDRLIYGEIYQEIKFPIERAHIVTLAALTTLGANTSMMREHIVAALSSSLDPENVREVVYQCIPYAGVVNVEKALEGMNDTFTERFLNQDIPVQGTTDETTRFARGLDTQVKLFGDAIKTMHENAAEDVKHIKVDMLSGYCFGDFYTRNGLSLEDRELVTFAAIASLGCAEKQLQAHIEANLKIGNTRQDLIDAITVLVPYIGFPKSLNALNLVESLTK